MNSIETLPFTEEHVESVYLLGKLSLKEAWDKPSILKELNNKLANYIVIKQNNVIVGFGGMWIIAGEANITNIAVHPEYRGNGLGNEIVKGLLDVCITENVSDITLEVRKSNITAQNLYKKFGFVEEGIRKGFYPDNNEDAIIMWKRNILSEKYI